MRFTEIGQQLRAYRLESGLRAEEIAARLGVSRAALYRYEKGEVIKLDTVKRLAELLKISPLSLLGIGVEYYNRPVAFFERLRQLEENVEQVLQVSWPTCYLTSSEALDNAIVELYGELAELAGEGRALRAAAEQVFGVLAARKRDYAARRPSIIAILPAVSIQRFLEGGVGEGLAQSERVARLCREAAVTEVEHIATLMDTEPMGLQFGLLPSGEPNSSFEILRSGDRATLAINPFRPDGHPSTQNGVAMITAADEAVAAHQRVAEACWRQTLRGPAAAARVRQLIGTTRAS